MQVMSLDTKPQSTIELGHTYAPHLLVLQEISAPTAEFAFGDTEVARSLRDIAEHLGPSAVKVALLDDIIARDRQVKSQDSWRWELFIQRSIASLRAGTGAEVVACESNFVAAGREIVERIHTMCLPDDYRLSKDGRRLLVGSGDERLRIPLLGFKGVENRDHPSCPVLDFAWLDYRLGIAPEAVTILGRQYSEQQRQVGVLADLLLDIDEYKVGTVLINEEMDLHNELP